MQSSSQREGEVSALHLHLMAVKALAEKPNYKINANYRQCSLYSYLSCLSVFPSACLL